MIDRLQTLILWISRTWWAWLLVAALGFGSLRALLVIGADFPAAAGGAQPFDLQNGLSAAEVYPQLAGYTDRARELYLQFTIIDYAFPFFAGLFIAATVAACLRASRPRWHEAVVTRRLLPVLMIGSAFDWLENLAAIALISLYPSEYGWLPALLVMAKRLKLACVLLAQGVMALLLIYAAGHLLVRRVRGR